MEAIDWERTAILIIDMQKAFVEPGQPLCVAGAAATVPAIARAVATVREHGGQVIWVRREYAADGSDMEPFRREQMRAAGTLDVMAHGSYGAQPIEGLEGEPTDHVVIKKRYSGFFETDLKDHLDAQGIQTLIIAGTQTPNCVRATAIDALQHNYRTIAIANCTSSQTQKVQQSNLTDLTNAGIEVIDSIKSLLP